MGHIALLTKEFKNTPGTAGGPGSHELKPTNEVIDIKASQYLSPAKCRQRRQGASNS